MTALYVVGPPGVGKTTAVNRVLADWRRAPAVALHGQLKAEPLTTRGGTFVGWHLGRSRPEFGGTDALSMSVHPQAVEWARHLTAPPPVIVGEGQRLATVGFLTALASATPVVVAWLTAPEVVLDARRKARGSRQDPAWCKAGATRAARLSERLRGADGVTVVQVDATLDPADVGSALRILLRAKEG